MVEILEYAEAFWQNHQKIENGQKYIERIEKGESEIEKRRIVDLAIKLKFDSMFRTLKKTGGVIEKFCLNNIALTDDLPERDLASFTLIEDKLCALGLFKYGYGYWNLIRNDIRNSSHLAFNWVSKTRSVADI